MGIEAFVKEVTGKNTSWSAKPSMVFAARRDPIARILNVDLLAVVIAILLPWSTSGVVIFVVLWVIALTWTFELRAFVHLLTRPIYLTPVALFVLALAGTLWSDAAWDVRFHAVGPAGKLLVLPLLLYHFERTARGIWILIAFLISSTLLI